MNILLSKKKSQQKLEKYFEDSKNEDKTYRNL